MKPSMVKHFLCFLSLFLFPLASFASSTPYGIYNSSATTINAEQIYWPATTTGATMNGPYSTTTNSGGHGDNVLPTYIDFDPWVSTVSGDITTNTTWTASSTYVVDGTLTVNSDVTLNITAATIVKFKTGTSSVVVNGALIANSAASSSKIYFTSYLDDIVGGDTNGDSTATSPAAGDWDTIKVSSGAFASTSYAVVRYAGGTAGTSVWNSGGTIALYNTEVATGTTYGIYESSGGMSLIASNIHDHSVGIQVGGTASVNSSWIHDNSSYGLYNSTAATSSVSAIYNYWGDVSGPYHAIYNASGTGDAVSNYVDFEPWLEEMHYLFIVNGALITSVDGSKDIDWGGTSDYMNAWYGGVDLWNSLGEVTVATDTIFTVEDLTISDVNEPSEAFVAVYNPNSSPNDTIKFNDYYMASSTAALQLNATAHELGHALGLWHSYLGNMMNSFVTSTTTLGYQDILDYDYCWFADSCR
jgi:hypothetical protein